MKVCQELCRRRKQLPGKPSTEIKYYDHRHTVEPVRVEDWRIRPVSLSGTSWHLVTLWRNRILRKFSVGPLALPSGRLHRVSDTPIQPLEVWLNTPEPYRFLVAWLTCFCFCPSVRIRHGGTTEEMISLKTVLVLSWWKHAVLGQSDGVG